MSLPAVIDLLRCPVCGSALAGEGSSLCCVDGHAFDVARQGYVMLTRTAVRHPGDTADMVAARERVQSAGLLATVTTALVSAVGVDALAVLDVGAGTAHHTAAVVAAVPGRRAVAVDSSKAALRRAARAHDQVGAVGCDLVEGLPIADGAIDAVLVTFAPRNVEAFERVLAPGGRVIVVTPGSGHLHEVAEPMGMLAIGEDKVERLEASLAPLLTVSDRRAVTASVAVDRAQAVDLALMGPAGFHTTPTALAARAGRLPQVTTVTVDVALTTFTRPT